MERQAAELAAMEPQAEAAGEAEKAATAEEAGETITQAPTEG